MRATFLRVSNSRGTPSSSRRGEPSRHSFKADTRAPPWLQPNHTHIPVRCQSDVICPRFADTLSSHYSCRWSRHDMAHLASWTDAPTQDWVGMQREPVPCSLGRARTGLCVRPRFTYRSLTSTFRPVCRRSFVAGESNSGCADLGRGKSSGEGLCQRALGQANEGEDQLGDCARMARWLTGESV